MCSRPTLDSSEKLGVSRYVVVATIDDRTSGVCQSMNGKVFSINDAEAGENMPPFHPNCRSIVVPFDMNDYVANGENKTYDRWLDDYLSKNYEGIATSKVDQPKTNGISTKKRNYGMKEWQDELDYNISKRVESLSDNLTQEEKMTQVEKIIKEEAYRLQTAYLNLYTYGDTATREMLIPLFEKYDTFKSPELYNIITRSLYGGSIVGLSRAIAESGGSSGNPQKSQSKNADKAWGTTDDLINTATSPGKGGVTPVGRAFQKHTGNDSRAGTFTGEISGNAAKNTEQGMKYLNEILNNPNSMYTVRNTKAYGEVLDVRLPDGTGARWSVDGKTFYWIFREIYNEIERLKKMKKWTADFTNNPFDDYNLIVEILCDEEEIAVIRQTSNGLELKWYPNNAELLVPLDWLSELLIEAKKRLS